MPGNLIDLRKKIRAFQDGLSVDEIKVALKQLEADITTSGTTPSTEVLEALYIRFRRIQVDYLVHTYKQQIQIAQSTLQQDDADHKILAELRVDIDNLGDNPVEGIKNLAKKLSPITKKTHGVLTLQVQRELKDLQRVLEPIQREEASNHIVKSTLAKLVVLEQSLAKTSALPESNERLHALEDLRHGIKVLKIDYLKQEVAFSKAMRAQIADEKKLKKVPPNPYLGTDPVTRQIQRQLDEMNKRLVALEKALQNENLSANELDALFKESRAVGHTAYQAELKALDNRHALLDGRGPDPLRTAHEKLTLSLHDLMVHLDELEKAHFGKHMNQKSVREKSTALSEQIHLVINLLENSGLPFDNKVKNQLIGALKDRFLHLLNPDQPGRLFRGLFYKKDERSFVELLKLCLNSADINKSQVATCYLTAEALSRLNDATLLDLLKIIDSRDTLAAAPTERETASAEPSRERQASVAPLLVKAGISDLEEHFTACKLALLEVQDYGLPSEQIQELQTIKQRVTTFFAQWCDEDTAFEQALSNGDLLLAKHKQQLMEEKKVGIQSQLQVLEGALARSKKTYQTTLAGIKKEVQKNLDQLRLARNPAQPLDTTKVTAWLEAFDSSPVTSLPVRKKEALAIINGLQEQYNSTIRMYMSKQASRIRDRITATIASLSGLEDVVSTSVFNPYQAPKKAALDHLESLFIQLRQEQSTLEAPKKIHDFEQWLQRLDHLVSTAERAKDNFTALATAAQAIETAMSDTPEVAATLAFIKTIDTETQDLLKKWEASSSKNRQDELRNRLNVLGTIRSDFDKATTQYAKKLMADDPNALQIYRQDITRGIQGIFSKKDQLSSGLFARLYAAIQKLFGKEPEVTKALNSGDFSYFKSMGSSRTSKTVGAGLEALQREMKSTIAQERSLNDKVPEDSPSSPPRNVG